VALHVQQMNLPSDTSEESAAVAENVLRELQADKYPHLAEMIVEHASSLAMTMRKSSSSGWISSSVAWRGSEVSRDAALSMEAAS
jgi:hypothetical protein